MIHPFFLALAAGICILLLVCMIAFFTDSKTIKKKAIKDAFMKTSIEGNEKSLALNRRTVFEREAEFEEADSEYSSRNE